MPRITSDAIKKEVGSGSFVGLNGLAALLDGSGSVTTTGDVAAAADATGIANDAADSTAVVTVTEYNALVAKINLLMDALDDAGFISKT